MSSAAKKQEKNQEAIRKFALKPENRVCMDCDLKSTPNVVMDFGIFVCSFCSGIHRSHQFKAKGISMTNFKDEEVEFLGKWGNDKAKKVWRATCKLPLPKANDERAIKDFIRKTYVDKEWYKAEGSVTTTIDEEPPKVQPIQSIIDQPVPLEVKTRKVSNAAQPPAKQPVKAAPAPVQNNDIFDFTDAAPVPVATKQQAAPAFSDDFEADFGNAPAPKQPAKKMNLDDLFGPSTGTPAPFGQQAPNPYGQQAPFGQQAPNPYGQQAPNPYGQPNPYAQPNPYGQQAPNPYGQQAPNPFGQPAPNPYGQQAPNPFGQPTPNPYGQQAPNPYGHQAPNPFGQPAPNPYGQQAPNPFGQPAPANPYGQQAPNPFGQQAPNPFGNAAPMPSATMPSANMPRSAPSAPATVAAPAPQKDLFADLNVFGNNSAPVQKKPVSNGFDDFGTSDWGAPAPKKQAPAANNTMDFPF